MVTLATDLLTQAAVADGEAVARWQSGVSGRGLAPFNVSTGREYTGKYNRIFLLYAQMMGGAPPSAGARCSTTVQADGCESPVMERPEGSEDVEAMADLVSAGGSPITVTFDPMAGKGSFRPRTQEITLPAIGRFESTQAAMATLFHEMGHSTGTLPGTEREMSADFGSLSYAREELIAESVSWLLLMQHGYAPGAAPVSGCASESSSVAYLDNWMTSMRRHGADPLSELSEIASQAVAAYKVASRLIEPFSR